LDIATEYISSWRFARATNLSTSHELKIDWFWEKIVEVILRWN